MFPNSIDALNNYFFLMNSNGVARIYRAAREMGILAAIDSEMLSLDEICQKCDTDLRGTELVLQALLSFGVVELFESRYRVTELGKMLLNSSYRDLGDSYWDSLEVFLRDGTPLVKMDSHEQSEQHYQQQAAGLAWMMKPATKAAAKILLSNRSRTALTILDIGSGAAAWSLAVAAANPESHVTAIDWPAVLQVAMQTSHLLGLQNQLTCQPGNYHEVSFDQDKYDIAVLANVTHLETEETNLNLLNRVFDALQPEGEVVVIDALPADEGSEQTTFALYALGLALRTERGKVHSRESLSSILIQAGFETPGYHALSVPPYMMGMLVAKKPTDT